MEEEKVESIKSETSPEDEVRSGGSLTSVESKVEPEVKQIVSETKPPLVLNRYVFPFEMLFSFLYSSCYFTVSDKMLFKKIGLDVGQAYCFISIGYFLVSIANVPVGIFADTFGKYNVTVFGVVITVVTGVLNLLLHYFFTRPLYYCFLTCFCFSAATYGARSGLIHNEIESTAKHRMEFYIFLLVFGRTLVHVLALICQFIGIYCSGAKLIFTIVALTSGLISFALIIYLRNKVTDVFEMGMIYNCIKALRRKDDSDYYHNGKIAMKIMSLLTSIIGFGVSGFILHSVVVSECSIFFEEEPYIAQTGANLVIFILECFTLIFLQFAFLKIFRKWKVDLIDLRLQGIAYNFMGIAMIFLCVGVSGLRHMVQTVENLAQFRVYNGADDAAILKYDSVSHRIDPGGLTVIKNFPCPEECEMETFVEFENKAEKLTSNLKGEEVQSFTHIIYNTSFHSISTRDPISPKKNKTTFFVLTNANSLYATLIFDEEYPISIRPNLTDYVIFNVPQNVTLNGFRMKKSNQIQNISFTPEVEKIYSIFVFVMKNETVLNINELKLELKMSPNPFFIILPAFVGAISLAFSKLSLYRFILIESPIKLLGTLSSYLFMVWYVGILSYVILYALRSIWITTLVLFTCLHILFNFCFSKSHADYIIWRRSDEYRNLKLKI